MIVEGDLFDLTATLSSAGLVGTTSAVVQWGDGFESPATTVTGGDATGPLRIRFDYSLDSGNFFGGANQSRRTLLQTAADAVISRFADNLSAITPAGKAEWIPAVFHPSSGPANQPTGTLVSLTRNLAIASNEIIIYAGARDLPGNRVGVGGTGSYSFPAATNVTQAEIQQINAFRDVVATRGQAGATTNPQTDLGPWGGSVSFDNQTQWYFGNDPSGIGDSELDFISIATHEITHVLGFGINRTDAITSWDRLASSTQFAGPKARAAYRGSGNVPLRNDHWADTVLDQFSQSTLMAGQVLRGKRQLFTELDFAAMHDIGWDVLSTQSPISARSPTPDSPMILRNLRPRKLSLTPSTGVTGHRSILVPPQLIRKETVAVVSRWPRSTGCTNTRNWEVLQSRFASPTTTEQRRKGIL
jgi:hypothetical protein